MPDPLTGGISSAGATTQETNRMRTQREHLDRREFLKLSAQSTAALAAFAGLSLSADAAEDAGKRSRISYSCNGRIYINEVGQPDGKPILSPPVRDQQDFKPSWSKTGDRLVCFRRIKNHPLVSNWKTAIFVVNVDGSGFHTLSDGTHMDVNPTWTRDGKNLPIWNRKNENGGYHVVRGKVGGKPGEEVALTDQHWHTWAHSCLMDGRIFVNSWHPPQGGWGVFLITPGADAKPRYERVECELVKTGELHRASISPSEKKICFEYFDGHDFQEPGHTLYIADFDARTRSITNPKPFANEDRKPIWFAYPRWIDGESAVVYHSTETGKGQLYVYRLDDGSTTRVSSDLNADYRYPHGEAAPC